MSAFEPAERFRRFYVATVDTVNRVQVPLSPVLSSEDAAEMKLAEIRSERPAAVLVEEIVQRNVRRG